MAVLRSLSLGFCIYALLACGPSSPGTGEDAGGTDGGLEDGRGGIEGTVWAPGNAPDPLSPGFEIPVPGASVSIARVAPEGIPQQVYCEECVAIPGTGVYTDAKGRFHLSNLLPGEYVLTMQKAQFRLDQPVVIRDGETIVLDDVDSTLPSVNEPENGKWIPRMAVAVGAYDRLEDIFAKMGIGEMTADGQYVANTVPPDSIDFYRNYDTLDHNIGSTQGSVVNLVTDLERMKQYHIIFFPCSDDHYSPYISNDVLRNIRDYVAAGGKLYVSDWSGEWSDWVFPEQVQLGADEDTPAAAYDRATDTWDRTLFGDANGPLYQSDDAEAVDELVEAWLEGQVAPQPFNAPPSAISASGFAITGLFNVVEGLHSVQIGVNEDNEPVIDEPRALVIGGDASEEGDPKKPLTVSFQPAGCGRVIYTAYHTTESGAHRGLLPQERMLLYMIMELGECVPDIAID